MLHVRDMGGRPSRGGSKLTSEQGEFPQHLPTRLIVSSINLIHQVDVANTGEIGQLESANSKYTSCLFIQTFRHTPRGVNNTSYLRGITKRQFHLISH